MSATSCTLAELLSGSSITVDGVVFDAFNFNMGDDFGTIPVDPSLVTVTGASGASSAILDFVFDPALTVSGDLDFIAYIFSFSASTAADITSAALSFADGQLSIMGDASSGVTASLSNMAFLEIYADSNLGLQASDSAAATGNALSAEIQLSLAGFATDAAARLDAFRYAVAYQDSTPPPQVPLPAAAPLFLGALAGIGLLRRRRPRA